MTTKTFERYGNDCIIKTTLILDDDVLIVIERYFGGWCSNEPSVIVYTEDVEEKCRELIKELSND